MGWSRAGINWKVVANAQAVFASCLTNIGASDIPIVENAHAVLAAEILCIEVTHAPLQQTTCQTRHVAKVFSIDIKRGLL